MEKVNIFKRIRSYISEAKGELKKVTWPTKNDMQKTTIAVIVLSIIFGIYLKLVDASFNFFVKRVIDFFK